MSSWKCDTDCSYFDHVTELCSFQNERMKKQIQEQKREAKLTSKCCPYVLNIIKREFVRLGLWFQLSSFVYHTEVMKICTTSWPLLTIMVKDRMASC